MRVDSAINTSQNNLLKLKNEQKKFIEESEKELKFLEDAYKVKKNTIRNQGSIELDEQRLNNQDEYQSSLDIQKERLEELKNEFQKYQNALQEEKERLIVNHQLEKDKLRKELDISLNAVSGDANDTIVELEEKAQEEIKSAEAKKNREIERQTYNTRDMISKSSSKNEKEFLNSEMSNESLLSKQEQDFNFERSKLTLAQKGEIDKLKHQHLKEKLDRTQEHKASLEREDSVRANLMMTTKNSFEKKIEDLRKNQEEYVEKLQNQFNSEIQELFREHTKAKEVLTNKNSDSFYNIQAVEPIITETPDALLVAIPVPEHEKEQVRVSTDGQNIKLTLSRRFEGESKNINGRVDKNTRSEIFTSTTPISAKINEKTLTQNYDNGVLTFRFNKA